MPLITGMSYIVIFIYDKHINNIIVLHYFYQMWTYKKRNSVKIYTLEYSVPVNLTTCSNTQQRLYYVYVYHNNINV